MWPNPQFPADLATLTEEMLNENFLCSAYLEQSPISTVELFCKK